MLDEQQARQLCDQIFKRCGSDPAEVFLYAVDESLTRFANNTIHQNVAERNLTLHLRLQRGKRLGMASTNRREGEALDKLVSQARANADANPENPEHLGFSEATSTLPVDAFDRETSAFTPDQRAHPVGIVCRLAHENGLNASGAFMTGVNSIAIANTLGLFVYHSGTVADFSTVVMSEDSSGWAHASDWKVGELQPEALGQEAIWKAERGRHPREVKPEVYQVIFDPYVTEDLLNTLNWHGMGGQTVLEGRSWMSKRLGQQAFSPNISIYDDGRDVSGLPMPFDGEGIPKHRVDIVQNGVIKTPLYDRKSAKKAGVQTTGHALPPILPTYLQSIGPIGVNLFMAVGEASLDEMIRTTDRGLYITRFWYTRLVHPSDCVVTGMTRDGVFMIEKGELAYPVKNLRFTQSYVEALAGVEAVGKESRLLMIEVGNRAVRVPALKLTGFNFTGATV